MPIPEYNKKEDKQKFVSQCMSNETMKKDYPDAKQRIAICLGQTKASLVEQVCGVLGYSSDVQDIDPKNIYIPEDNEYIDVGEVSEDHTILVAKYTYIDPMTQEYYYFNSPGIKRKNNRVLRFISEAAEYQGRTVKLNKPFRTPDGPKKFSVYVMNDKNNIVKVNFGDPNMEIKRDDPERRKNFRARHQCDSNPGPKWKARYWSCKFWSNPDVSDLT
jgi:hypothetical protein